MGSVQGFVRRSATGVHCGGRRSGYLPLGGGGCTTMILARNGYLLNEAEAMLRKSGRVFSTRYGDSSVVADHFIAIRAWERMRKGGTTSGYEVGVIYSCLRVGTGIQRGFKGTDQIDSASQYSAQQLRATHGLLADGILHDALDGIALNTPEY